MDSIITLLKKSSAWIPIALSGVMFGILLVFLALSAGQSPAKDEGVGAHLFQIWLVLEVFGIGFFVLTEVPKAPRQALPVLMIQVIAVLIVCSPVFYFQL